MIFFFSPTLQDLCFLLDLKFKILWTIWISQKRKFKNNSHSWATKTYRNTGCMNLNEVRILNIRPLISAFFFCSLFGTLNVCVVHWCVLTRDKQWWFPCFNSSWRIKATLCVLSDLDELIRHGDWKRFASPTQINSTKPPTATSQPSPPAYTKEKGRGTYLTVG